MTSEIALYNKNSVALAADSATSWGHFTYNTTEKICQLAGRQPVGFMHYGMGSYMGINWSRVFGAYRQFLGAQEKPPSKREAKELPKIQSHPDEYWGPEEMYQISRKKYVSAQEWSPPPRDKDEPMTDNGKGDVWDSLGYVEHFLHFLESSKFAKEHLSEDNEDTTSLRLGELVDLVVKEVRPIGKISGELIHPHHMTSPAVMKDISKYNKFLEGMLKSQLSKTAEEHFGKLSKEQKRRHKGLLIKETEILNEVVKKIDKMVGKKIKITQKIRIDIRKLACVFLTTKRRSPQNISGIVIAGFGKEEDTPSVIHLHIEWKWRKEMKVVRINDGKAFPEDFQFANAETFAQADMIDTLIDGRHPQWDDAIMWAIRHHSKQYITNIAHRTKGISADGSLANRLRLSARAEAKGFTKAVFDSARKVFTNPDRENLPDGTFVGHLRYWNFLPFNIYRLAPSDLASLAEKLVETEVQFQYVAEVIRGVGGAVDVASITKENGFMWVKRKDTFDPALNPRTHHNPRESAEHI